MSDHDALAASGRDGSSCRCEWAGLRDHRPYCVLPERGVRVTGDAGLDVERLARALASALGDDPSSLRKLPLAELIAREYAALAPAPDMEALRVKSGWPTPNHMRAIAGALDTITPARYGSILRWVADLCDAALAPATPTKGGDCGD